MKLRQCVRIAVFCIASALLVAVIVGCAEKPEPSKHKVKRDPNLILVYAACALQPVVEAAKTQFMSANAGKSVEVVSDDPTKLTERIEAGEVPDVVVMLGDTEIGILESKGFLDAGSRQAFGTMRVAIIAPRGNPGEIHGPNDLLGSKARIIAIATPGMTSAGTYAKLELDRAKLWGKLQEKLSFKLTSIAALQAVSKGAVQAAMLYDPCLRLTIGSDISADSIEVVSTLSGDVIHSYAVLHKDGPNALLAKRFLAAIATHD